MRDTDVGLRVSDEEVSVVPVLVEQRVTVSARDGAEVPGAADRPAAHSPATCARRARHARTHSSHRAGRPALGRLAGNRHGGY